MTLLLCGYIMGHWATPVLPLLLKAGSRAPVHDRMAGADHGCRQVHGRADAQQQAGHAAARNHPPVLVPAALRLAGDRRPAHQAAQGRARSLAYAAVNMTKCYPQAVHSGTSWDGPDSSSLGRPKRLHKGAAWLLQREIIGLSCLSCAHRSCRACRQRPCRTAPSPARLCPAA